MTLYFHWNLTAASARGQQTQVIVEDLSSNGTFVNDDYIGKGKKVVLKHNDKLSLIKKRSEHNTSFNCTCPAFVSGVVRYVCVCMCVYACVCMHVCVCVCVLN